MPLDDADRVARLRETPHTLPMGARMERFVRALQGRICTAFERVEAEAGSPARFRTDTWARPGGGGGTSRVIEGGRVFEKGGVNVSAVWGVLPEAAARTLMTRAGRPSEGPVRFFATGLSLVMQPVNPYVPAVHANFRYFALGGVPEGPGEGEDALQGPPLTPEDQWFGGGADLTPYYPTLEDARHFHGVWKRVCDAHALADYEAYKQTCDRYFHLPHRNEARGIGGLFFDHVRGVPEGEAPGAVSASGTEAGAPDPEGAFHFVREAGRAFLPAYLPLVERHRDRPWGEREKRYQRLRRGRYAEFNLAYDRGTRFGLETGGRTESILMSLPPDVSWQYAWDPTEDFGPESPEAQAQWFFQPRDWLGGEAPEGETGDG